MTSKVKNGKAEMRARELDKYKKSQAVEILPFQRGDQ